MPWLGRGGHDGLQGDRSYRRRAGRMCGRAGRDLRRSRAHPCPRRGRFGLRWLEGERGSIEVGKIADAVVLDENLRVRHVILRGELLG